MNRGSVVEFDLNAVVHDCFNEAPIHESGKYGTATDAARREARFNEAPIHESGKSPGPGSSRKG